MGCTVVELVFGLVVAMFQSSIVWSVGLDIIADASSKEPIEVHCWTYNGLYSGKSVYQHGKTSLWARNVGWAMRT